jgi:hypothetical protein
MQIQNELRTKSYKLRVMTTQIKNDKCRMNSLLSGCGDAMLASPRHGLCPSHRLQWKNGNEHNNKNDK